MSRICNGLVAASILYLQFRIAAAPTAAVANRAEEFQPSDFIRFVEEGNHAGHLDSAIVTYRRADGATVHLVAALHIGEKSYYQKLSALFKEYDALLYEM